MKYAGLLLIILAFTATAFGQNLPSQFVISGETARKIHDFTTINLATAERIAETCERLAQKEGVAISIYILDNDGNHVYMHRMNRVIQNPDAELQQIQFGLFPNSGGLPIIVNDQMIGAVGVGGSAPRVAQGWSDEICAHKALTEVLGTQPPLMQDLPPRPAVNKANAPVPRFDLP